MSRMLPYEEEDFQMHFYNHQKKLMKVHKVIDNAEPIIPSHLKARRVIKPQSQAEKKDLRKIAKHNYLLAKRIFEIMEGPGTVHSIVEQKKYLDNQPKSRNIKNRLEEAKRIQKDNYYIADRLDSMKPYYAKDNMKVHHNIRKRHVVKLVNGKYPKPRSINSSRPISDRSRYTYFNRPSKSQAYSSVSEELIEKSFQPQSKPSNLIMEYTKIQNGCVIDIAVIKEPYDDRYAIFGIDIDIGQRYELRLTADEVSSTLDSDMLVTNTDREDVWIALLNKVHLVPVDFFSKLSELQPPSVIYKAYDPNDDHGDQSNGSKSPGAHSLTVSPDITPVKPSKERPSNLRNNRPNPVSKSTIKHEHKSSVDRKKVVIAEPNEEYDYSDFATPLLESNNYETIETDDCVDPNLVLGDDRENAASFYHDWAHIINSSDVIRLSDEYEEDKDWVSTITPSVSRRGSRISSMKSPKTPTPNKKHIKLMQMSKELDLEETHSPTHIVHHIHNTPDKTIDASAPCQDDHNSYSANEKSTVEKGSDDMKRSSNELKPATDVGKCDDVEEVADEEDTAERIPSFPDLDTSLILKSKRDYDYSEDEDAHKVGFEFTSEHVNSIIFEGLQHVLNDNDTIYEDQEYDNHHNISHQHHGSASAFDRKISADEIDEIEDEAQVRFNFSAVNVLSVPVLNANLDPAVQKAILDEVLHDDNEIEENIESSMSQDNSSADLRFDFSRERVHSFVGIFTDETANEAKIQRHATEQIDSQTFDPYDIDDDDANAESSATHDGNASQMKAHDILNETVIEELVREVSEDIEPITKPLQLHHEEDYYSSDDDHKASNDCDSSASTIKTIKTPVRPLQDRNALALPIYRNGRKFNSV